MTNTGKTLIVGLVLADLVICAYLLYPREEKKSAAAPEAVLSAPDGSNSRPAENHVIAGSIVRPTSPDMAAAANPNANTSSAQSGTKTSRVDVRPPSAAPAVATQPAMPVAPAVPAAPVNGLANAPAADMQTQTQLPQVSHVPQVAQPVQSVQPAQQPQVQAQAQAQQQPSQPPSQRSYARSRASQHAEDSRGHEDLRRRGSSDVGAMMTELLVRESAKLDPSLPPPPPTDPVDLSRRSTNPVAAAMTDQLVKESARVAPASGVQKQPGTQ